METLYNLANTVSADEMSLLSLAHEQGWDLRVLGARTCSTRVSNFSTCTRTQTTGNISTHTRT